MSKWSSKCGAPQDRADLNRRPDATTSRRNAARHRLLTAPRLLKARSALSCWGILTAARFLILEKRNRPAGRFFDFAGTENRSAASSENLQNQKRAPLQAWAKST